MISAAAPVIDKVPAGRSHSDAGSTRAERLLARFHQIRNFTNALCANLEPEDFVVQSMPDVSPTKWHLAHTTWFFETFILKKFVAGYRTEVPEYAYLFNSYYNAAGDMHRRDLRGLISRPTVGEAQRYRSSIDAHIDDLLSDADEKLIDEIEPILILGIHHEQQHQELLITDIKHVFAQNPLYPVFRERQPSHGYGSASDIDITSPNPARMRFLDFDEATVQIGHDGNGFSYDNESPRHRALVSAFSLASRPVTNGEYLQFIGDGGYARSEFWLSLGWISGFRPVDESEPVTHVSYFEADAYANWVGARLPTEFEWERAASDCPIEGNFVENEAFHPQLAAASRGARRIQRKVHVQPVRLAGWLLCYVAHSYSPNLPQLFPA